MYFTDLATEKPRECEEGAVIHEYEYEYEYRTHTHCSQSRAHPWSDTSQFQVGKSSGHAASTEQDIMWAELVRWA